MAEQRCFILGAGFSRCCGLPLASELTSVVWRARARRDLGDHSSSPEPIGREDVGYHRVQADLKAVKLLFPDCDCDPHRDDTWPDFEQLITSLDEAAKYQETFEQITATRTEPWAMQAKEAFLYYLEERLSDLTDAAPLDGLETVRQFLQELNIDNDTIVSFNWDVLLEIAAADLGTPVRYRDDEGPGLRLAKPHGSLNVVDAARDEYDEASKAINVHSLDTELEYEDTQPRLVLRAQDPKDAWLRQAWANSLSDLGSAFPTCDPSQLARNR